MNCEKLKLHAELLEAAIQANLGKSKDVDWLAQHPTFVRVLAEAKAGKIDTPRDLGLSRWIFESNIQEFGELSERLAEFSLLLRGWDLPSEPSGS